MTTTTYQADGAVTIERVYRYWVAIRVIDDPPDAHRALYRHESNEAAVARLTAILILHPVAHVEETHDIGMDYPISVGYTISLTLKAWNRLGVVAA